MSVLLYDHSLAWTPPSPLWVDAARADFKKPAILRFASDDFMEELQRLLATDPEKLRGHIRVRQVVAVKTALYVGLDDLLRSDGQVSGVSGPSTRARPQYSIDLGPLRERSKAGCRQSAFARGSRA